MSTTPRLPLFTDAAVELEPEIFDARYIRDVYEAARAKDAELIQMLVDGAYEGGDPLMNAMNAAKAAGFEPSDQ